MAHQNDKYTSLDGKRTSEESSIAAIIGGTSGIGGATSALTSAISAADSAGDNNKDQNREFPAHPLPKTPTDQPHDVLPLVVQHIDNSEIESQFLFKNGAGPQGPSGVTIGQLLVERDKYIPAMQAKLQPLQNAVVAAKKQLDSARASIGGDLSFDGLYTEIELDLENEQVPYEKSQSFITAYTTWLALSSIQSTVFYLVQAEENKTSGVWTTEYDKFIESIKLGEVGQKKIKGKPLRGTDEDFLNGYTYNSQEAGSIQQASTISDYSSIHDEIKNTISEHSEYVKNYRSYLMHKSGGSGRPRSTILELTTPKEYKVPDVLHDISEQFGSKEDHGGSRGGEVSGAGSQSLDTGSADETTGGSDSVTTTSTTSTASAPAPTPSSTSQASTSSTSTIPSAPSTPSY